MGVKKISIFDAEPGMVLAKPVVVLHAQGRELMQPGFMIDSKNIKRFAQWGIENIYVEGDDENYKTEVFSEAIRFLAKQTYEDAITSLTKLSRNLVDRENTEVGQVTKSISQILDVISLEESLLSLLSKIKESEEYIYQHNVDVCVTALIIGRAMDVTGDDLLLLGSGCLLHDLGLTRYQKDKWDNSMLNEPPANIRKHPEIGKEIASAIKGIDPKVLDIIHHHHEYMDGSGYPSGLKGDEIGVLARITAISEAYNSLILPYNGTKKILPHKAMSIIMDPKQKKFDPAVMRAFMGNMALYPSGTFVQLSNNMRGVVVSSNRNNPLRPKLLVLYEDVKKPVKPFYVDLNDNQHKSWYIDEVVDSENIVQSIEHLVNI